MPTDVSTVAPSNNDIPPASDALGSPKASACRTLKMHLHRLTDLEATLQKHNRTVDEADMRISFGQASETPYWQRMKNESMNKISEVEVEVKSVRRKMVPYLAQRALGRPLPTEIINMIHYLMDRPEEKTSVANNLNSLAAMAENPDLEEQVWDLEMAELYAEADAENTKEIMETLDRCSRHLERMATEGGGFKRL
ncbi:MAG: hypothetical protein Q9202_001562 [Teloschistes flavicans]